MPSPANVRPEQAELPLILALDLGTSSVRALLFDAQGRMVEEMLARRAHLIRARRDGAVEADADELVQLVCECIEEILERCGDLAAQIAGVSLCTFVSNIFGVDKHGQAVTPLITYADTRPAPDVLTLQKQFDESVVHNRTGCHFHPSYFPACFLWIARTHPEWLTRSTHWMSIGEYLALKFFGETRVSYSVASWSGLFNRMRLEWDDELLAALPITREQLSPLCDVDSALCGLTPGFARRWPTLARIPWFPAIGDGAGANIGVGCLTPESVAVTVGTSSAVRVALTDPVPQIPNGLWCYRVDHERVLLGGALSEGGSVFAWMRRTLELDSVGHLEAELAEMRPDAHGLTFLPLLTGERCPGWRGDLRGALHGISLATTPVEIVRAALEGVACRIGWVYQLLAHTLATQPEVIVNGGAVLQSPTWIQIIADVLAVPVKVSQVKEASARGAALLALHCLGRLPALAAAPDWISGVYTPDSARHEIYQRAMQRQQELYAQVSH